MKFIVTHEVGKLAKWLRILGFDTVYQKKDDKRELVLKSLREDRIVVSRNQTLARYTGIRLVHISSDVLKEQLAQLKDELGIFISEERMFTRCVLCNDVLHPITKEEVKGKVPVFVYDDNESFVECPTCKKIYWRGTHWGNVKEATRKLTNTV
ncbi:MAG: Mut7-C RNAse domain-containing protein [Candidatus Omnitrophota bacterium]